MTSHGKARPILTIAMIAALAGGVAACNSGSSGAQYGTGTGTYDQGYSNPGSNESGSLNWQNQAQQNANSAIDDMGPGGAADPVDDGNSVSYSDDSGN
jgi:hypothetical protein